MKKLNFHRSLALLFITALLFSSCGMMKKNDFANRKYTHFKKGESTVEINKPSKIKNNEVIAVPAINKAIETSEITTANKPSETAAALNVEKTSKTGAFNNFVKVSTKEKMDNAKSFVNSRMKNTSNKAAANADGYSLLWIIVLILLLFWAIGLASGGFGMGGLINVLLVIALILLILWLLQVV